MDSMGWVPLDASRYCITPVLVWELILMFVGSTFMKRKNLVKAVGNDAADIKDSF